MTKRLLITLSHAIERFALSPARPDEPVVVIAMFQKLAYFQREAEVYRRIAELGAVTVIGIVEDLPPALPPGVSHVLLRPDEPLAAEWSVTVLGPHSGATLVATDTEAIDPDALTLEGGRRFTGRWSLRREDAYRELLRLRAALGPRLPGVVAGRLTHTLEHLVSSPGGADESRAEAALWHLLDVLDRQDRRRARLRHRLDSDLDPRGENDSRSGLPGAAFLHRWLAGSVSGTLPVGLMLMRFPEIGDVRREYGPRAEQAALQIVGGSLRRCVGPADRAVHLQGNDFLLVVPTRESEVLVRRYGAVSAELARGESHYPFVPLAGAVALTVTRDRPLPLPALAATAASPLVSA